MHPPPSPPDRAGKPADVSVETTASPSSRAVEGKASPTSSRKLPRLQAVVRRIGSTFSTKAGSKSERGEKDFLKAYLKKFDADEVEVLRKVYKELSARNPESGIDKATFLQYFPLPGLWGERLFQRFDYKCLGVVDYEEFLVGIAVCCRGTKCERIHVLFQVFDLNGDGVLQKDELVTMLSNLPNLDRYIEQSSRGDLLPSKPVAPMLSPDFSRCGSLSRTNPRDDESLSERLESLNFPEAGASARLNEKFSDDYEPDYSEDYDDNYESTSSEPRDEDDDDDSDDVSSFFNGVPTCKTDHKIPGATSGHSDLKVNAPEPAEVNEAPVEAAGSSSVDVEAFVDKIIEECEYSESDSLTFIEFKTWLEKNDTILAMFSDCLHEEAWGLQGNALYRRTSSTKINREGRSRRFNFARDSRGVERRRRALVDIRPDAFYKVKRLFTVPARSTLNMLHAEQDQQLFHLGSGVTRGVESPSSFPEDVVGSHCAEDAPDNVEIYPRQTRDILNLQLLDLIMASNPDVDLTRFQGPSESSPVGEPLCCPSCGSLLVVCPRCSRRFPTLRLSQGAVVAECRSCLEGKVQQFRNCWHCNWSFAQAAEHVDHCEPLCEGFLYKIGRHMHKWRKRYFVLVDNLLYYYSSKDDTKPRGFIFLEGCFVETLRRPSDSTTSATESLLAPFAPGKAAAPSAAGKWGFSIIHGGGKIPRRDLYAATEKERQLWVDSLRSATNQQDLERVYQMSEVVGQGKFSVVHRAVCRDTNENVAIKIIDKSKIDGHEAELLRSEIAILRLLRHPHVISFREILDTPTTIHIIMEYVAGGELYDLLQQKRRLPEVYVNRIIFQLLSTVAYLHKCGIIHRDLKPENILLTNNTVDADIKITDFGLSCICGPDEDVMQPCGTLAYVAPEVLTLQGYRHKVDVWSVGVLMYLLLRGRLPFPVGRPVSAPQSSQHYYRPLTFEGPVWNNVSSSAKDLLKKLLQPNPEKRISAQDALQHIWLKNPTAVISEGAAEVENGQACRSLDQFEAQHATPSPIPSRQQPELIDVSAATFSMVPPPRPPANMAGTNVSHIDGAQIPLLPPH